MFNVQKTVTILDISRVPFGSVLRHLSACWIRCQIVASFNIKAKDSDSNCTKCRFYFCYTQCSHSIFPLDLRGLLHQQQSWRITLFTWYLLFQWTYILIRSLVWPFRFILLILILVFLVLSFFLYIVSVCVVCFSS